MWEWTDDEAARRKNVFLVTLQSHTPHSDYNCVLLSNSSTYHQEWRGPGDRSGKGPGV